MQFESAEEQEAFLSEADHLHKWSGEYQYENLLLDVLQNGVPSNDRTGVGTISLFGTRMEFDLSKAFPLITSKKVFLKGVIYELLWFLKGDTNVRWLQEHGVHIWDEWADANGDLGPSTDASGAVGRPTWAASTRSPTPSRPSAKTRTPAASSSTAGTSNP